MVTTDATSLPMPIEQLWDFAEQVSSEHRLDELTTKTESLIDSMSSMAAEGLESMKRRSKASLKQQAESLVEAFPQLRSQFLGSKAVSSWTSSQKGRSFGSITRDVSRLVRQESEKLEESKGIEHYAWIRDSATKEIAKSRLAQHFRTMKPGNPIVIELLLIIAGIAVIVLVLCYFFCSY